ncbi:MAG: hypothetical protein D4R83_03945 [Streptomycetaceae bacterium]|nr:MAG: hypothetical protein D4R83_03945 [Streptomycetaceae bacterium]
MSIEGWDHIPDGFDAEFQFDEANRWLRYLALTPYFERFAYPIAIKRGFARLWPTGEPQDTNIEILEKGWMIQEREKTNQEFLIEGSLAILSDFKPTRLWEFIHKQRKLFLSERWTFDLDFASYFVFTRYGRQCRARKFVHQSNGTSKRYLV